MKNKIVYVLALILLTLLFVGNVNAAEYADKEKDVIITMKDLGLGGTTKSVKNYRSSEEEAHKRISSEVYIDRVNQEKLNNYGNSKKEEKANVKVKLPNSTTKVELFNEVYRYDNSGKNEYTTPTELKIETINGQKYAIYNCTLNYSNCSVDKPIKNDIYTITLHNYLMEETYSSRPNIKVTSIDGKSIIYELSIDITFISENEPYTYYFDYINKYGQSYQTGGQGGGDWYDKSYLDTEWYFGTEIYTTYQIPNNINFNNAYYQLKIDVYQGESINVENFGTLYYGGIVQEEWYDYYTEKQYMKTFHIYRNSLDKLKNPSKTIPFQAKTKTGYVLHGYIFSNYQKSDLRREDEVIVENQDLKLSMIYSGYTSNGIGKIKLGKAKAKKTDILYNKLKNGYSDIGNIDNNNRINIDIDKLCIVSGTYKGNINITFDVGIENNGKEYVVRYQDENYNSDYYKGKVKDGKVTITVNTSNIPYANDNVIKLGDINKDGKINTKDAREVLLAYIGKNKLTEEQRIIADVNKDGKINTKDARQILLYYIGVIKQF